MGQYFSKKTIVKENQQAYYNALEAAGSAGESTPFVEFMLENILQSLKQFLKQEAESNQKSNQKVTSLIHKNSKITIREICNVTGLSESGVKKIIKKLKDDGELVRIGALKGGYWEVK